MAMTCTHAALKRREFLQLGLKYDNLLMEESAQILEIETFIPMLLQVSPLPHLAFGLVGSFKLSQLDSQLDCPDTWLLLLRLASEIGESECTSSS